MKKLQKVFILIFMFLVLTNIIVVYGDESVLMTRNHLDAVKRFSLGPFIYNDPLNPVDLRFRTKHKKPQVRLEISGGAVMYLVSDNSTTVPDNTIKHCALFTTEIS